MAKRSNLIVSLGLAVFVAGAAATFFVVRNGDDGGASAKGPQVLVAEQTIPAGTSGETAVEEGLVKTQTVDESRKPANALTDAGQLADQTAKASIPEGSILTSDHFAVPQTKQGGLTIPAGKTAMALQLEHVAGGAGYVSAGDRINIYGLLKDGPGSQSSKLIMQNTEVLRVGASGGTVEAGASPIFLLAVSPQEGERLAFLTSFQALYFALAAKDSGTVPGTSGTGAADALKQLS